jgi:hypothetical protein
MKFDQITYRIWSNFVWYQSKLRYQRKEYELDWRLVLANFDFNQIYYFFCQQLESEFDLTISSFESQSINSCRFAVKTNSFRYDLCKSSNSCKSASQSEHFSISQVITLAKSLRSKSVLFRIRPRKSLSQWEHLAPQSELNEDGNSELRKVNWDENQEMKDRQSHR